MSERSDIYQAVDALRQEKPEFADEEDYPLGPLATRVNSLAYHRKIAKAKELLELLQNTPPRVLKAQGEELLNKYPL